SPPVILLKCRPEGLLHPLMNHQASVTSRGSEQRALPSAGSNSEVFVGELRGNPAAGCAVQESNLDQEGLVDFLDRLRLFGEGGGQCVHAYWSALVFLDDRQQQLAVDVIETVAVNFQHLERGLSGGQVDLAGAAHLRVI